MRDGRGYGPFRLRRNHPNVPLPALRTARTLSTKSWGVPVRRGTALTLVGLLVALLAAVAIQLIANR